MSISSMIREEVRYLAYSGEDIKVRELSRKYNCSPSLVVKNIYKVEEKENLKHLTKFGVKGKVNLLIIDFEGEHLNNRENSPYNIKDTPSSNITISKKIKSEKQSPSLNKYPSNNQKILERKNKCSPKENLQLESNHNKCSPSLDPSNNNHSPQNNSISSNNPSECSPSLAPPNNNHSLSLAPPNNNRSPQNNSIYENNPSECLPSLAPPNNNCSPQKNSIYDNNPSESSLSLDPPNNNRLPQNNSISSNNPSECSLFNVHSFKKEKEKFSYNLLKEKEKNNNQKFINKFLGFQDLEILDIFKYQKEILKIYFKYGGRLRESDIKYGKGILYYATPKQFEAILLKVIREKKGEIPPISYIYRVSERMDLKNRERKQTPKLFGKDKNSKNKKEKYSSTQDSEEYRPLTSSFSYMGLTGEEALKAFFGKYYKRENFIGLI